MKENYKGTINIKWILFSIAVVAVYLAGTALVSDPMYPSSADKRDMSVTKESPAQKVNGNMVIAYPAVPGFEISGEYSLSVNGKVVPVFKTGSVAIAQFAFTGKADLAITYKQAVPSNYIISPKRITWNEKVSGNAITLSLTTPRRFALHYGGKDGLDNADGITEKLFIFAEPLETESPKPGDPGVVELRGTDIQGALNAMPEGRILYIGPGTYANSAIQMRSKKSIYVAAGAKLAAGFSFSNVRNSRVFGRGAIDHKGRSGTGIRLNGSDSCRASDLLMLDRGYGIHTYITYGSDYNFFRDLKMVTDNPGTTGCNTDGVDVEDECYHNTADNMFIYNTDDPTATGFHKPVEYYTFKNSVVWNHGCGRGLKVGTEVPGMHYSYFNWENIDIIHAESAIEMRWQNDDGIPTSSDVIYHHWYVKNIYSEFIPNTFVFQLVCGDAFEMYFQNLVFAGFGGRSAGNGFRHEQWGGGRLWAKITRAEFQHMVVAGKVINDPVEARFEYDPAQQNVTFRTDEPTEVNIRAASLYASPGNPASFTVSRHGGSNEMAMTLKYSIYGCARNGVDYNKLSGEVTIAAGANTADVVIKPKRMPGKEIKNVLIEVDNVMGPEYMLGPDFQAQITIVP